MKIVNRADVRMVKLRAKLSFAFKSFEIGCFLRQFRRQNFDDDGSVELRVNGFVNRSLPASADFFEDFVLVYVFANHIRFWILDFGF